MNDRVECLVLLLYGRQAEVLTPDHGADNPLRVEAAGLARQLAVEVEQLPGMRFTAVLQGAALSDVQRVE